MLQTISMPDRQIRLLSLNETEEFQSEVISQSGIPGWCHVY